MKEIYDIKKIDFEECSLKEMLTIISYLVVNTDFSDISLIDKCVSICTQKLDDSLRLKEELTTEYFYLLDILKKKKRSLDKFDSNRNYIRKIEDSFTFLTHHFYRVVYFLGVKLRFLAVLLRHLGGVLVGKSEGGIARFGKGGGRVGGFACLT